MADPETAREQRAARIQAKLDKKKKAEDAKKAKAEAVKLARAAQAEAAKQAKAAQAQQKKSSSRSSRTSSTPAAGSGITTPTDLPASAQGPSTQKKTRSTTEKVADEDEEATPCLHPDDPANFLKLSNALRLLLSRVITDEEIDEAFDLLSNYCSELVTVCSLSFSACMVLILSCSR